MIRLETVSRPRRRDRDHNLEWKTRTRADSAAEPATEWACLSTRTVDENTFHAKLSVSKAETVRRFRCVTYPNQHQRLCPPPVWMDQDATWYEGRPRPRPHCVTWGPSAPLPPKTKFSDHVYCGQTVAHLSYCWALVDCFSWKINVVMALHDSVFVFVTGTFRPPDPTCPQPTPTQVRCRKDRATSIWVIIDSFVIVTSFTPPSSLSSTSRWRKHRARGKTIHSLLLSEWRTWEILATRAAEKRNYRRRHDKQRFRFVCRLYIRRFVCKQRRKTFLVSLTYANLSKHVFIDKNSCMRTKKTQTRSTACLSDSSPRGLKFKFKTKN